MVWSLIRSFFPEIMLRSLQSLLFSLCFKFRQVWREWSVFAVQAGVTRVVRCLLLRQVWRERSAVCCWGRCDESGPLFAVEAGVTRAVRCLLFRQVWRERSAVCCWWHPSYVHRTASWMLCKIHELADDNHSVQYRHVWQSSRWSCQGTSQTDEAAVGRLLYRTVLSASSWRLGTCCARCRTGTITVLVCKITVCCCYLIL